MDAPTIDRINILQASRLAMRLAVESLSLPADVLVIDALEVDLPLPQRAIIHGDAVCRSIAAASILAKVTRDRLMRAAAMEFPWYSFDTNKGYPCAKHRAALDALGPSTIHRTSWAFMPALPWSGIPGCQVPSETLSLF